MSRRSLIKKFQVLSSVDSTSAQSSEETDVSGVDFIFYEITVDAAVNATLSVYYSNDSTFNSSTAKVLNFGTTTSLVGATDTSYIVQIENPGIKWLQLRTANNGGTGNISAWISATVRGA